jgi:hypothetical protein
MAIVKLAELKMILDNKIKELKDIYGERSRILKDTFKINPDTKEEEKQNIDFEFNVDDLTAKADKLELEIMKLKYLLSKANVDIKVDYIEGQEKISLQEAIVRIKALRESLPNIKYLGELKETRQEKTDSIRLNGQYTAVTFIEKTKPTYNTKTYKEKYEKLQKQITKLEMAISSANYSTDVEIPEWINLD